MEKRWRDRDFPGARTHTHKPIGLVIRKSTDGRPVPSSIPPLTVCELYSIIYSYPIEERIIIKINCRTEEGLLMSFQAINFAQSLFIDMMRLGYRSWNRFFFFGSDPSRYTFLLLSSCIDDGSFVPCLIAATHTDWTCASPFCTTGRWLVVRCTRRAGSERIVKRKEGEGRKRN